jgi:MFS family permease
MAFAVLLITGGRLGDRYGPRRMFLLGASGFTAASVVCGLSVSPAMLIAARIVQGSFGAILLPQVIALLTAAFAQQEMSKALSAYAPVLSLAAVVGPLVAGGLIRWNLWGAGWRLIFFVNLFLGTAALAGGLRYLSADGPATLRRLDGRGVIIIAAATFLVVYPLIQGRQAGWPWWTFALLAAGLACVGIFARYQLRAAAPLIEPSLLCRRSYLAGAAIALAFFAAAAGVMLLLSLYAQYGLGYSALGAGTMLTPAAAGNVTGALVALRLSPRLGGRAAIQVNLAVSGAGLVSMALVSMALVGGRPSGLALAGPVLALGFGLGGIIAPLFSAILTTITPAEAGSASGSLGAIQQLAGSVGVATIATLYASASHPPGRGLAITALATGGILVAGAALTLLLPGPPDGVAEAGRATSAAAATTASPAS